MLPSTSTAQESIGSLGVALGIVGLLLLLRVRRRTDPIDLERAVATTAVQLDRG
jgi:LPXTG-motif cell wall-anchored protein